MLRRNRTKAFKNLHLYFGFEKLLFFYTNKNGCKSSRLLKFPLPDPTSQIYRWHRQGPEFPERENPASVHNYRLKGYYLWQILKVDH